MSDQGDLPSDHKDAPSDHEDAASDQGDLPSDHKDAPSDHEDAASDHQDAPTLPNATGPDIIQQRIDDVTDKSLAATERIVQVVTEAREVGEKTSAMLVHQGEQLSGIKRQTEDLHEDLEEAEENISKLECCTCGLFRRRRRGRGKKKGTRPRLEFHEHPPPQPATVENSNSEATGQRRAVSGGPFIKKITGDEREEKIENNLRMDPLPQSCADTAHFLPKHKSSIKHTSEQVAVLGEMAEQQGRELDRHAELIEDIHTNVENENTQLEKDIKRLRKLE